MFPTQTQIKVPTKCWRLTCVTAVLGVIQIMVGLINVGLGPGRTSTRPKDLASIGALYWLGAVFIITGVMSLLAGQCPSPCLVRFTVFMNVMAAILAITGVVLYSVDLAHASLLWMCDLSTTERVGENCRKVAFFAQRLVTSMDVLLILLAVLQLCVSISLVVRSFIPMKKGGQDVEKRQWAEELQINFEK
ncbi:membrane-spanning 4-domains subfamily A member 4A-like [Synchiropus picturatus]